MAISGFQYIRNRTFWPLILIKVSCAFVYGGGDILNVAFSEMNNGGTNLGGNSSSSSSKSNSLQMNQYTNISDIDMTMAVGGMDLEEERYKEEEEDTEQSQKLGMIFFVTGLGCFLGPLIADRFTNMKSLRSLLHACTIAFALQAMGFLCMGIFPYFVCTLIGSILRAAGSSISWVNSQIILQSVVKPDMLGRVLAVDYGLALLSEASSAVVAGLMLDDLGFSAMKVCIIMGMIAILFFFISYFFTLYRGDEVLKADVEEEEDIELYDGLLPPD